ncbi:hypothetical protein CR513_24159, partial [Mucuna pruriens]
MSPLEEACNARKIITRVSMHRKVQLVYIYECWARFKVVEFRPKFHIPYIPSSCSHFHSHGSARCYQSRLSRSRRCRSRTERPEVVRGFRLACHRTLVDLILGVLAIDGEPSSSFHGDYCGKWDHRIHTLKFPLDEVINQHLSAPSNANKVKTLGLGGACKALEAYSSYSKDVQQHYPRPTDFEHVGSHFNVHKVPNRGKSGNYEGGSVVSQKKRKLGEEKQVAIRKETDKLLSTGFIKVVRYLAWLANIVMVKKANRKWRMCTHYIDLNKVFPKDSYPFPSIDRLVDDASGYGLLSFMDVYFGYNQIWIHPEDEEKIAFIINNINYCYKVISFGLKNAGATYQRLMDRIFT